MLKLININTNLTNYQLKEKYLNLVMDNIHHLNDNDIMTEYDWAGNLVLDDRYGNKITLDYGTYRSNLIDCHNILVELVNSDIDDLATYHRYKELAI